ncbi:hypothetical protein GF361_03145 [Candidatus Woesearchaeota archaeon]|nr:hypothetical protein [Candidatus Woesearchaeota archaeon]
MSYLICMSTNFTGRVESLFKKIQPLKVLDFGSGDCSFARHFRRIIPKAVFYCIDKSYSPVHVNLGNIKKYKEFHEDLRDIDIAHSSLVFHEIGKITEEGTPFIGLIHDSLKKGGYLIIEDFVSCTFRHFYNNNKFYWEKVNIRKYKALLDLFEEYIKTKDPVKLLDYFKFSKKLQNLFDKYVFKKHELSTKEFDAILSTFSKEEYNLANIILNVAKYLDLHTKNSIKDFLVALESVGFRAIRKYTDNGFVYQFICQK